MGGAITNLSSVCFSFAEPPLGAVCLLWSSGHEVGGREPQCSPPLAPGEHAQPSGRFHHVLLSPQGAGASASAPHPSSCDLAPGAGVCLRGEAVSSHSLTGRLCSTKGRCGPVSSQGKPSLQRDLPMRGARRLVLGWELARNQDRIQA